MENASKALIIAGAILLAIVIISLGLIVVNNVRDVTDNTNLSEQEIQSFNAKFIAYEGNNVSGSRVNSLIQQVISTNQATINNGGKEVICIAFPSSNGSKIYFLPNAKGVMRGGTWTDSVDLVARRKEIYEKNDDDSSNITSPLSVNTGKNYTVTLEYGSTSGLVEIIKVTENAT